MTPSLKKSLIFGLLLTILPFCSVFSQNSPTVVQNCNQQFSIKDTDLPIYKTICSEDDQHAIKLELSIPLGQLTGLKIYDGDNQSAPLFQVEKGTTTYTSSRLCLTIKADIELEWKPIELSTKCVPIDRSKWPLQTAKIK